MNTMNSAKTNERLLLNSREAAGMLGISPRTLWELTNLARIKAVRIGRLVKYDPRDLMAFIDSAKS